MQTSDEAANNAPRLSPPELRARLTRFCAMQERSPAAVRRKLLTLGCPPERVDQEMAWLHEAGYWHARRYAEAFVRGHSGARGWGPIRMRNALRLADVPEADIQHALALHLPRDQQDQTLRKLIAAKQRSLKDPPGQPRLAKLVRYLQAKGYTWDAIQPALQAAGEWR